VSILLGVNIDHVATLRQARGTDYPDPVQAAMDAEKAGADGITIHLREDRRHIQEHDVWRLKDVLKTRMNLEMAVTDVMIDFALNVRPEYACLVPEKRAELTTEGGLDVVGQESKIKDACHRLSDQQIKVSLFIDADSAQIDAALRCGAPFIELHTGHYADAITAEARQIELTKLQQAAVYAQQQGLTVNAGHGLNVDNVAAIAKIPGIYEMNIGHSIIARSIFIGLTAAIVEIKTMMQKAAHG
jgi:pyridoxine 5-phosphate synthase